MTGFSQTPNQSTAANQLGKFEGLRKTSPAPSRLIDDRRDVAKMTATAGYFLRLRQNILNLFMH